MSCDALVAQSRRCGRLPDRIVGAEKLDNPPVVQWIELEISKLQM